MSFKSGAVRFIPFAMILFASACAPSVRMDDEADAVPEPVQEGTPAASEGVQSVEPSGGRLATPRELVDAAPTPTPRFDPENPDWPLRYQELYEAYLDRFEAPELESEVTVFLEGGRELRGILLEAGAEDVLLSTASGELRLGLDMMQPRSQARFFADRFAHFYARHRARQEYEAWQAAQSGNGRPASSTHEVTVRPRNTEGVDVDPLHAPRRVRRNGQPPVNEEPTGRVRQVEEYILRHAGSPESLRVHHWGRVQPHGDGFTVRVRYSLEGAAGFGLSNEDMIFFMYADGTVYQRAAYRGD
ncbi:MAG: hypothetical protein JJU05_03205 [Verrucomicrobia bacterium]|nr:hypothetical protein [Verrucomicrobiota bacterium]MCH8528436.1 hypothetical protein [Kiritimatiellia bacterium]